MWLILMKIKVKPITDLVDASNTKGGFCTDLFLPDTREVLEQIEVICEEQDARVNPSHLKEDTHRLNRASMKMVCTERIYYQSTV